MNKNSAQISPYAKLKQTIGPTLGGLKQKGRRNSTFFKERIPLSLKPRKKETSNTVTKKKNENAEKYCTNKGAN